MMIYRVVIFILYVLVFISRGYGLISLGDFEIVTMVYMNTIILMGLMDKERK